MRWRLACACFAGIACFAGMACVGSVARGAEPEPLDEQAQRGGSPARNNVRNGQCLPESWDVGQFDEKTGEWLLGTGRNIRWVARLGTQTHGTPVVAEGKVFIGTNNGGGRLPRYPATVDLGCLLAFRAADGEFLWQHSSEKLPTGRVHDWPLQGVCSTPLVKGNRLWFVSNRCEVLCLDTEGFYQDLFSRPARERLEEANVVWRLDMRERFGVSPHNMSNCSITSAGRALFVCTSNGVDEGHMNIPAPNAPSFLALDKMTGEVLWSDASPGLNILHGQWCSPCYGVFDGQGQVVFGGGDGWLYSFDPAGDGQGGSKLLWKFDCNPKDAKYSVSGRSTRNHLIATPMIHGGFVYAAVGEDPEHGEGNGRLCCIDARRRGDVSNELAIDRKNGDRPLPSRRLQAVNPQAGEAAVANPNSALIWEYVARDANRDGKIDFEEQMHRTLSSAVLGEGLLMIPDFSGLVHCLDAATGEVCWTHDLMSETWSSPLAADGRVYMADADGKITIFKLSKAKTILAEIEMGRMIYSTPAAAGGVLYVPTTTHLFAIASDE
ncbi:MAG TPA: PQQ-binding-like beta-propeller repeat protein [Pirellulales bacterium]|nr:PQQ-binding-like beta-propeller repeat protein [Pirellulales bacterium]